MNGAGTTGYDNEKKVKRNLSPIPHSIHKNQFWVIININGKEKQQNFQKTLQGNIFITSGYLNKTDKTLTIKEQINKLEYIKIINLLSKTAIDWKESRKMSRYLQHIIHKEGEKIPYIQNKEKNEKKT